MTASRVSSVAGRGGEAEAANTVRALALDLPRTIEWGERLWVGVSKRGGR
jgi:hypothetical protein